MDKNYFIDSLKKIRKQIIDANGTFGNFEIGEPASQELINQIENKYGIQLPSDFVRFVTTVSGKVNISWYNFTDEWWERSKHLVHSKPDSGRLYWDVNEFLCDRVYYYFENPRNFADLKQKLYLSEIPNGDIILFDLRHIGSYKPIVYLSHDESYDTLPQLAPSFENYVDNLLKIGLAGIDLYGLEPYLNDQKGGIDPDGEAALEWRKFMGLI